jgi:hypothetical protein
MAAPPGVTSLHTTYNNNSKFVGGASLQNKLQGFASFIAYQECFRRGESTTKHELLERSFGDANNLDSIGLGEQQLVNDAGVFAGLFTVETTTVTEVTTNVAPSKSGGGSVLLVLKPELQCLGFERRVVVGATNGIN